MGCIRTRGCGGEVERDGRHAVFGRELLSQMGWISTDEEGGLTPFRIWLGGSCSCWASDPYKERC
jgi:hypothetical protein